MFHQNEGHSNVTYNYEINNFRLGAWVSQVRAYKNIISKERYEKLEKLDFIWDAIEFEWNAGFERLIQYKKSVWKL